MDNWETLLLPVIHEVAIAVGDLSKYPLYRDVQPTPHAPASVAQIVMFEDFLEIELPPSYRAFLRLHNGYEWLAFPGHVLAIEDVMPGGDYYDDIREWKKRMADASLIEALDGIVIAYLDQPNNWVYLDPNKPCSDNELAVVLHVPGTDPDIYPNLIEFVRSSIARANLASSIEENKRPRET